MRSEEDLKPLLQAAFKNIVECMTKEMAALNAQTTEGLERRSVLVSLDVDLAALIISGALMAAGPTNESTVLDEIVRRTRRMMAKYEGAADVAAMVEALLPPGGNKVPGNGTVN